MIIEYLIKKIYKTIVLKFLELKFHENFKFQKSLFYLQNFLKLLECKILKIY